MFVLRFRTVAAIALMGLAGFAAAEPTLSSLISSETVQEYRQAVDEARQGRTPIAQAMLEGLLLDRPVRVAIENPDHVGRGDEYTAGVEQGIDAWSRVLADCPFRLVREGEHADIVVRFVSHISYGGDTQGLTSVRRHFSWRGNEHDYQIFGDIKIRDNAFGRRLSGHEVGRVLAHELGHVLGLGDDYDGPGVMSAFREGQGALRPSREEVRAISALHDRLRHALRQSRDEE